MRRMLFSICLLATGVVVSILAGLSCGRLVLQPSLSMPRGLYWLSPLTVLQRGVIVRVRLPEAIAREGRARGAVRYGNDLVKPVAGLPGDLACWEGGYLTLTTHGHTFAAYPLRATDRAGHPIAAPQGCRVLAPHEVLVVSDFHQASWDSRYFGPVPLGSVLDEATLVLAWPSDQRTRVTLPPDVSE